jgi:putative intracellular protease/amidase
MKPLIFIAPNDYKDETLNKIKLFFEKWGLNYKLTSYSRKECKGYHGSTCIPDINTNTVNTSDFDGIIIVDGKGIDTYKLYEYRPLLDLVYNICKAGNFVAAVGNGIKIVARANIIKDKKISMPDDEETRNLIILFHGIPSERDIEISDNICTIKDSSKLDTTIPNMLQHLGVK